MRKFYITLLLLLASGSLTFVRAQEQIRIFKDGNSTRFTNPELIFSEDATSFTVADSTYETSKVDSITVVHTVTVTFAGDTAFVDHGHALNVTDTIKGAHVKLISTNTKSELEFVLQGESTHGSFTYDGPLKCKFYLNGLKLKSDKGAAIDIKCGKRIDMILNPGTVNTLEDAADGDHKAALHCKGHLEVSGSGSLTVTGNTKHGIDTKEYMEIKKSTGNITIAKAVSDAMHIGQYFMMNGGNLTISGKQKGDGLQVETMMLDDEVTPNPDKENNGQMIIRGGLLTITAAEDVTRGIKVPGDLIVSGGEFRITASGDGTKGISVSGNMTVGQETGTTKIQVKATGDTYEYDDEDDNEESCVGIRVKGNLTINAGTVNVINGKYAFGIRLSKDSNYYKSDEAVVSAKFSRSSN